MKTKIKYLGEFYIEYFQNEDNEEESTPYLINEEDEDDIYELGLFMRASLIIKGIDEIHAVYSETNNSSIVLQLNESCDGGKLWRVW